MKKTLCFVLIITVILGLAGCGAKGNENDNNASNSNNLSMKQKSPEGIAEDFINSLLTKNYEEALATFALPETSCVQGTDIQWFLPKSSFKNIENIVYEKYDIESEISDENEYYTTVEVTVKNAKNEEEYESFTVNTALNKENKWTVDESEFYYKNFSFCVPGGKTEVYINDKTVSNTLSVDNVDNMAKKYKIPFVGKRDITIRVKSGNFDYSTDLTPSENNEVDTEQKVYPPVENTEAALSFIKNTWNSAYSEYVGGCKESDFQKYISVSADTIICKTMYDGYKSLLKNNSNLKDDKYENYSLTQCVLATNDNAYWVTDSVCYLKFNYELTWYYVLAKWNQNMKESDAEIYLNYENGEYKIQILSTSSIFSKNNAYTNEW